MKENTQQQPEDLILLNPEPGEIRHVQELFIRSLRMPFHKVLHGLFIPAVINTLRHDLIDDPLDLSDMQVTLQLRARLETLQGIDAHEIECQTVREDILARHLLAL